MASAEQSKKMRILLIPFFATSHIGPHTDFAIHLTAARPGSVEPSIAVTPANVTVVQSALQRHGPAASSMVKIVTYPFPRVDGLAPGVENLSTAGADAWRIDAAAIDEALSRPAQEALLREQVPDAVVTDYHFFWNSGIAAELGLPCVVFSVIGAFAGLVMHLISGSVASDGGSGSHDVAVPGLPGPEIRIPVSEVPEFLIRPANVQDAFNPCNAAMARCLGVTFNTFADLKQEYREAHVRVASLKRSYFVGPVSLPLPPAAEGINESPCIRWLDSKPSCSVVYVCFGTYAAISDDQLRELALGLEASEKPFLWAARANEWTPPEGWEERVAERGVTTPHPGVAHNPMSEHNSSGEPSRKKRKPKKNVKLTGPEWICDICNAGPRCEEKLESE